MENKFDFKELVEDFLNGKRKIYTDIYPKDDNFCLVVANPDEGKNKIREVSLKEAKELVLSKNCGNRDTFNQFLYDLNGHVPNKETMSDNVKLFGFTAVDRRNRALPCHMGIDTLASRLKGFFMDEECTIPVEKADLIVMLNQGEKVRAYRPEDVSQFCDNMETWSLIIQKQEIVAQPHQNLDKKTSASDSGTFAEGIKQAFLAGENHVISDSDLNMEGSEIAKEYFSDWNGYHATALRQSYLAGRMQAEHALKDAATHIATKGGQQEKDDDSYSPSM